MTEKLNPTKLRSILVRRRDAIFDAHRRTEEARRTLLEPETEFEEASQNESLGDVMASLDEQEEREVEAINNALTRIETGDYPVCQSCGKRISAKRLDAVPWTTYCARCAKQQEERPRITEEEGPTPAERAELHDALETKAIFDELREDGVVDVEELRISVQAGSVHLEGFLPSKAQHRRLREIVEDHIGLANITDEIVINRQHWERSDRACGLKTIDEISSELAPQEDDLDLEPADTMQPEER